MYTIARYHIPDIVPGFVAGIQCYVTKIIVAFPAVAGLVLFTGKNDGGYNGEC
jgi:hypothetical protein